MGYVNKDNGTYENRPQRLGVWVCALVVLFAWLGLSFGFSYTLLRLSQSESIAEFDAKLNQVETCKWDGTLCGSTFSNGSQEPGSRQKGR